MDGIKIIRTDCEIECDTIDHVLRSKGANLVLLPDGVSEERLIEEARDADLILMCYAPITEQIINSATRLKAIIKYGVGIDAIDIPAASKRAIPVVNVPEYAEETVAEGAFALLIALAKKLTPLHMAMQQEEWVWPTAKWMGSDIAGKTLGLVGTGRIGRSMARMAGVGFRAKVLGYDPHVSPEQMKTCGIEKRDSLKDMLSECDFVSIHTVLNEQTRHLVGKEEIDCMKPSAILINVSRGAIIDEIAMLDALKLGKIAGAGLDVYSQEPLNQTDHPLRELYGMDNVILSPHLTFFTTDAMRRLEEDTLDRCFEALEGKPMLVKSKDPRLTCQQSGVRFLEN